MTVPHPGELRHPIDIGRTVNVINENGYAVQNDLVQCHVWAKAEDSTARYFVSGSAENAERTIWFTIRWRNDILPGMWVLWNGEKYAITEINDYDFKHRYLRLTTVALKGVK